METESLNFEEPINAAETLAPCVMAYFRRKLPIKYSFNTVGNAECERRVTSALAAIPDDTMYVHIRCDQLVADFFYPSRQPSLFPKKISNLT